MTLRHAVLAKDAVGSEEVVEVDVSAAVLHTVADQTATLMTECHTETASMDQTTTGAEDVLAAQAATIAQ